MVNLLRSDFRKIISFSNRKMADVLFEYVKMGASVKVTAIEAETKTEAVVIVPVGLSEAEMQARALQKLLYILKKKDNA